MSLPVSTSRNGLDIFFKRSKTVARFFLEQEYLRSESVRITGEDAHHISRVLRLKIGDEIECAPGTGEIHVVRLTRVEGDLVEGIIVDSYLSSEESPIITRLYQGLAKGDKMDFTIQKAVELGISEIVPYTSRYTVVKLNQAQQKRRLQRWERIAREAAKQSKRARLPIVQPLVEFSGLLERLEIHRAAGELILIPYEHEKQVRLQDIECSQPKAVSVLIGPEGGFHPTEVAEVVERGAHVITLGPRILRTETAGLVALSLVGYRWGDLA